MHHGMHHPSMASATCHGRQCHKASGTHSQSMELPAAAGPGGAGLDIAGAMRAVGWGGPSLTKMPFRNELKESGNVRPTDQLAQGP